MIFFPSIFFVEDKVVEQYFAYISEGTIATLQVLKDLWQSIVIQSAIPFKH